MTPPPNLITINSPKNNLLYLTKAQVNTCTEIWTTKIGKTSSFFLFEIQKMVSSFSDVRHKRRNITRAFYYPTQGSKPCKRCFKHKIKKKKNDWMILKLHLWNDTLQQVPALRWEYRRGSNVHYCILTVLVFLKVLEHFWPCDGSRERSYEFSCPSRQNISPRTRNLRRSATRKKKKKKRVSKTSSSVSVARQAEQPPFDWSVTLLGIITASRRRRRN